MKYLMLLASFFTANVLGQNLPLLPLAQTYETPAGATDQGTFHIGKQSFDLWAGGVSSGGLSLELPDGTLMHEANAAQLGFLWQHSTNQETGGNILHISTKTAPIGSYGFTLSTDAQKSGGLSITEAQALQFRAFAGVPGLPIEPGKPFSISMALFNGQTPATGAEIKAELLNDASHSLNAVVLKDDGQAPDRSANDGLYTTTASVDLAGSYRTVFTVAWNDQKGRVFKPFNVANAEVSLAGGFTANASDSNQNGGIDAVQIVFPESQPRTAGRYTVTVEVVDAEGRSITETDEILAADTPISVTLATDKLEVLGAQPWRIASVNVWNDVKPVARLTELGELTVDRDAFEKDPMTVVGIVADRGVDLDGDGVFEELQVDVRVETAIGGSFGVSSDLRSPGDKLIGSAGLASLSLPKGSSIVTLKFLGSDIGGVGEDGPFKVTNFLIYPTFYSQQKLSKLVGVVGETNAYACSQFVGCGSDLASEIQRIANALCEKHGHQLLVKLNRVDAIGKRHPDVAERQLQALHHKAKALERSGSCPPAEGWQGD